MLLQDLEKEDNSEVEKALEFYHKFTKHIEINFNQ
jgi:hypothetical protein